MSETAYRKLAERLDAIPNGFTPTDSGVELRLLARIFTPEEALLASVMRLGLESADAIASRTELGAADALVTLGDMARKGLVRARTGEGGKPVFGLLPFAVGIYEEQLPRMDEELATLFEQYYQETRGGGMVQHTPALHRVIPVEEAVPFELEIFPYERASELIEGARSWGVRDCICRVQQRLVGKGCSHPLESCLVFAPVEGAFDGSDVTRTITKEEALRILRDAAEAGLVHSTSNHCGLQFYICNCCVCCCGIMRGVAEFDLPTALARSDFRVVVDAESCTGCGICVERCQFGASSVDDGTCVVDYRRCVGCGLCVGACPGGALTLERRAEGDTERPPADMRAWMARRANSREISIEDVL